MNELTKKKIGQKLNEILAKRGVLQKELAEHIGVPANTISYYLSGERSPDLEKLIEISKFLNISTDYLLGLSDEINIDIERNAASKYTDLSEKAVEVLHYNSGQIDIFNSNMLAREISLLIEEYYEKQGASNSLMHLIMGYPIGGFVVSDAASKRISNEIDNFFSHHTAYTSTNDFQNILKTVYFEKLQKSFEKYKSFSRKEVINNGKYN